MLRTAALRAQLGDHELLRREHARPIAAEPCPTLRRLAAETLRVRRQGGDARG